MALEVKNWFASKTVWTNIIAVLGIVLQKVTGTELIDPQGQLSLLALINIILRFVTKQPVA